MSIQSKLLNVFLKVRPNREAQSETDDYKKQREATAKYVGKIDPTIQYEELKVAGQLVESYSCQGNKDLVFYIHGGGFTTGSATERRDLTQYIVKEFGYNCISVNYRLAPESKWPTQLLDVYEIFNELHRFSIDPTRVIVMGESAGGTLSLDLGLMLRNQHKKLPRGIIALSPPTNHADQLPSHLHNSKSDYILRGNYTTNRQKEAVYGKEIASSKEKLRDPYISPFFAEYSGLPPIFLSVSNTEVLYDDSTQLYERLKKEGHRVEIDIQDNQCHAFAAFPFLPEAKHSLKKAFDYIEKNQK